MELDIKACGFVVSSWLCWAIAGTQQWWLLSHHTWMVLFFTKSVLLLKTNALRCLLLFLFFKCISGHKTMTAWQPPPATTHGLPCPPPVPERATCNEPLAPRKVIHFWGIFVGGERKCFEGVAVPLCDLHQGWSRNLNSADISQGCIHKAQGSSGGRTRAEHEQLCCFMWK